MMNREGGLKIPPGRFAHTVSLYFSIRSPVIDPPDATVTIMCLGKIPFGTFFSPLKMIIGGSFFPSDMIVSTTVNLSFSFPVV